MDRVYLDEKISYVLELVCPARYLCEQVSNNDNLAICPLPPPWFPNTLFSLLVCVAKKFRQCLKFVFTAEIKARLLGIREPSDSSCPEIVTEVRGMLGSIVVLIGNRGKGACLSDLGTVTRLILTADCVVKITWSVELRTLSLWKVIDRVRHPLLEAG